MKNYKTLMLGSVATSALLLGAAAVTTPAVAKNVEVGHKKGKFYLKTKDGKFSIIPSAQFQMKYEFQDNDDEKTGADNNSETGFSARRVRFGVGGRAGHKKLTYKMSMNVTTNSEADQDDDGGGMAIFDSYLQWKFSKALALRAGTWKQRFTESHSNSSGKLQFVDRARGTGNRGRLERDTGLGIRGKVAKMLNYELSIINGNTRKAPAANGNQSYHAHLRVEPFGNFGAPYEGDIKNSKKLKVQVAGAVAFKDNVTFSTRTNQNTFISVAGAADIFHWTVGAGMKWRGFGLYGEFVQADFRDADSKAGSTTKIDRERLRAWNVEASYFLIPKKWAIAGRWEYHNINTKSNPGGSGGAGGTAVTQANGGANQDETRFGIATSYYFRGHAHRITADWIQIQDPDGATDSNGATTQSEDNRFRIQWQTRF